MFHHRVPRLGVPLRSFLVLAFAALAGCYQGEWRIGVEMPVATTTRLVPTRDVERWELTSSTVPNIVQVRGNASPRCRNVLFGTMSRTDTGRFKRLGSGWWSALAITTGIAGGAAGGFGVGGWFANLYPEIGKPVLYAGGGALVAGGLASCIAALVAPSKVRLAFCGMLVGLGGSVIAGAVMSALPGAAGGTTQIGSSAAGTRLIDVNTFQNLAFAGGGLAGTALVAGLISASWRGYIDRERVIESEIAQSWDQQTSEQPCSGSHPLSGRTAALLITSEQLVDGVGSDAAPLKVRVALTGQQYQAVDLRGLRQALPSCGALRVQLAPDIVYEPYVDDYTPPMAPDQINPTLRPIHGIISPVDGLWLAAPSPPAVTVTGERKRSPSRAAIPGISPEVLVAMERRCRSNRDDGASEPETPAAVAAPPTSQAPAPRARPPSPTAPAAVALLPVAQVPAAAAIPVPAAPAVAAAPASSSSPAPTPIRRSIGRGDGDDGECSTDAQQSRYADCEHQCGRALELSSCLFTFRKCHIEARAATQAQKEREACDLAWEQCLFTANVAPGSWRRCVDGCAQANEPLACQTKKSSTSD